MEAYGKVWIPTSIQKNKEPLLSAVDDGQMENLDFHSHQVNEAVLLSLVKDGWIETCI